MRTFFFVVLLLCLSDCSIAQNIVDSFWSVKFGSDIATTKAIIKKVKNFSPAGETENALVYKPGTFGGYTCNEVFLLFIGRKFTSATIDYPSTPATVFPLYNVIRGFITKKYGDPARITEEYTPPYHEGDGDEVLAIRGKHARVETLWYSGILSKSYINVRIKEDLTVVLTYWNDAKPAKDSKNNESEF